MNEQQITQLREALKAKADESTSRHAISAGELDRAALYARAVAFDEAYNLIVHAERPRVGCKCYVCGPEIKG